MSTMLTLNAKLLTYILVAIFTAEILHVFCRPHSRNFVLALPITSKPLESTAENLAWQAWLMLPPEEKNQVKSRKVTPKSIFILPLRGQCPPNHHKVNSKCIPIIKGSNSLLIDPNVLSLLVGGTTDYDYADEIISPPLQPNIDREQQNKEDELETEMRRNDMPPGNPLSSEKLLSIEEESKSSNSPSQRVDEPLKFSIFESRFPTDYETNEDYLNISDENLSGIDSQELQSLNSSRNSQWPSTTNNGVVSGEEIIESIPDSIAFQVNALASQDIQNSFRSSEGFSSKTIDDHSPQSRISCDEDKSTATGANRSNCSNSSQAMARVVVLDNDAMSSELVDGEPLPTVNLDELLRNEALMPIVSLNRSSSLPAADEAISFSKAPSILSDTTSHLTKDDSEISLLVGLEDEVGVTTNPPDFRADDPSLDSHRSDVKMLEEEALSVGILDDREKREEEEYEHKDKIELTTITSRRGANESDENYNNSKKEKDDDNDDDDDYDYDIIMTTIIPPAMTTISEAQGDQFEQQQETQIATTTTTTTIRTKTTTESRTTPFSWLRAGQVDRTVHGEDVHLINGLAGIDIFNDDVVERNEKVEEVLDESTIQIITSTPTPTTTTKTATIASLKSTPLHSDKSNENWTMKSNASELGQTSEFAKYATDTTMENAKQDNDDVEVSEKRDEQTTIVYRSVSAEALSKVTNSSVMEKTASAYAGDGKQPQKWEESGGEAVTNLQSTERSWRRDRFARSMANSKLWSKLQMTKQGQGQDKGRVH